MDKSVRKIHVIADIKYSISLLNIEISSVNKLIHLLDDVEAKELIKENLRTCINRNHKLNMYLNEFYKLLD